MGGHCRVSIIIVALVRLSKKLLFTNSNTYCILFVALHVFDDTSTSFSNTSLQDMLVYRSKRACGGVWGSKRMVFSYR